MKIHIVQKGDTLWKIAEKYDVDFEQLKSMNTQLSDPDMLMPGMKIKVPTGSVHVKKHHKEAPKQTKMMAPTPPPLPYEDKPSHPQKEENIEQAKDDFSPLPEANIPMPSLDMNTLTPPAPMTLSYDDHYVAPHYQQPLPGYVGPMMGKDIDNMPDAKMHDHQHVPHPYKMSHEQNHMPQHPHMPYQDQMTFYPYHPHNMPHHSYEMAKGMPYQPMLEMPNQPPHMPKPGMPKQQHMPMHQPDMAMHHQHMPMHQPDMAMHHQHMPMYQQPMPMPQQQMPMPGMPGFPHAYPSPAPTYYPVPQYEYPHPGWPYHYAPPFPQGWPSQGVPEYAPGSIREEETTDDDANDSS